MHFYVYMFNHINISLIKLAVVYFDQRLGAAHSNTGQKMVYQKKFVRKNWKMEEEARNLMQNLAKNGQQLAINLSLVGKMIIKAC